MMEEGSEGSGGAEGGGFDLNQPWNPGDVNLLSYPRQNGKRSQQQAWMRARSNAGQPTSGVCPHCNVEVGLRTKGTTVWHTDLSLLIFWATSERVVPQHALFRAVATAQRPCPGVKQFPKAAVTPEGICAVCGATVVLRRNGTIGSHCDHERSWKFSQTEPWKCDGSHQQPKSTISVDEAIAVGAQSTLADLNAVVKVNEGLRRAFRSVGAKFSPEDD